MNMTIDWNRAVHIDRAIEPGLVNELIPRILLLRQESNKPITVGINSPGGYVSLLSDIQSLVRGPNQTGAGCELITVVTSQAHSAAAMLLAMGDYAVALPHTDILFHDVRYGAVHDVTPSSAMVAAKDLEVQNDAASLKIAMNMFPRWMWMYIEVHYASEKLKADHPTWTKQFEELVLPLGLPTSEYVRFDLVALLLFVHKHLAPANECLLENALVRLGRWGLANVAVAPDLPAAGDAPAERPQMLDGIASLYEQIHPGEDLLGGKKNERDLSVFMLFLAASLKGRNAQDAIEHATREIAIFRSIDNPRHWQTAMRQMLGHKYAFFKNDVSRNWNDLHEEQRQQIIKEASPVVRVVWLLCVQVARELFSGEHRLRPTEALVLGLVDEVPGTSIFQCRRDFDAESSVQKEAPTMPQISIG